MPEPVSAGTRRCRRCRTSHRRAVRTGNRESKNARFCRACDDTCHRVITRQNQPLETHYGGLSTSAGRGGRLARRGRRSHVKTMRIPLLASLLAGVLIGLAGTAGAQVDHRFPGASSGQFAPPAPPAPTPGPPVQQVQPYPNTESFARDRIQSQGYKVQRIERQVDGAWKAEGSRVPPLTPPLQQRVPSKVTIFPDGRMLEE